MPPALEDASVAARGSSALCGHLPCVPTTHQHQHHLHLTDEGLKGGRGGTIPQSHTAKIQVQAPERTYTQPRYDIKINSPLGSLP